MNDMLLSAAAGFIGGRGGSFLDAILKPTGTAIGEDLLVHYRRLTGHNVATTVDLAAGMLYEAGDSPHSVPGRILFPLLNYAAVEEDDMLRNKWAALLANAASSTDANKILPAYSEILKQLTSVQAQILDWLFDKASDGTMGFLTWPDVARADIEKHFHLSHEDYALFVSDMDRLQVLEGRRDTKIPGHLSMTKEQMQDLIIGRWDSREKYNLIALTTLGIRFMFSCMSPAKVQEINARIKSR